MAVSEELFGREKELKLLASWAEIARSAFIEGVAGVGKSALLRAAQAHLPSETHVERLVGSPGGSRFGAVSHLIGAGESSPIELIGAIRHEVERRRDGRSLLYMIDDIHALDVDSATIVHQSVVRDGASLLASLRSGEPMPGPIDALRSAGAAASLVIGPLDHTAVGEMVGRLLPGDVDQGLVDQVVDATGGLALYVEMVVRSGLVRSRSGGSRTMVGSPEPHVTHLPDPR